MPRSSRLKKAAKHKVATLQKVAHDKIVTSLGELASSIACRFCCGNTLSSPDHVKLVYEKSARDWSSIAFPSAKQADMQQLLAVCSATVASFGEDGEEVTDRNYHDALKFQFTTSFQLSSTPVLGEIQKLMMPDMRGSIRAELCELNLHSGPGGHFKAHIDAPQSNQMFGSLVVCLPTQFSGGALVTRHQGKEVRFDWSSSPQQPMQKVLWAAFFSDVEHEVLPVTDGHRLTLTYNLYCVDRLQVVTPPASITNSPFYHELRAAVSNPHFLQDGGVLGFSCQHDYVFKDLNCTEDLPFLLKGADNTVYMTAESLGLPVIVKPILDHLGTFRSEKPYRYILPEFNEFFANEYARVDDQEQDEDALINDLFGTPRHDDRKVLWCQEPTKLQPAFAYIVFGNEASCSAAYQSAAILVCVPKWSKRQALGIEPQQSCLEEVVEPKDGTKEEEQESRTEDEEEEGEGELEDPIVATYGGPDMNNFLCCDSDDSI